MHDFSALYAAYLPSIAAMNDEFSSHEFILDLARRNQKIYIEALSDYRVNNNPFQVVHGVLSQRLREHPNEVEYVDELDSVDIFGNPNRCAHWRKRSN
jgi:hypothetical protein